MGNNSLDNRCVDCILENLPYCVDCKNAVLNPTPNQSNDKDLDPEIHELVDKNFKSLLYDTTPSKGDDELIKNIYHTIIQSHDVNGDRFNEVRKLIQAHKLQWQLEARINALKEVYKPIGQNGYSFMLPANEALPLIKRLEVELTELKGSK